MTRIVGLLVLVWLVVGAVAAGQRGYFTHAAETCAGRRDDRGNRARGPAELLQRQPKSDELQCAQTQLTTHGVAPRSTPWS